MSDGQVVVIGAGQAGLAAGAELRRAGMPAVILDKADSVASAWRTRYDRLKLNTSRWVSKLPGARHPRGTPLFPSRDEMVAYLEGYAADNELDLELGTTVERLDGDEDGGGWILRTSSGERRAPAVIIATGFEHTPVIPDWPGRDDFGGRLLHAADYRNGEPFRDQEVLVVGPGCSGMEIAYDLTEDGAKKVRLAVRTPPSIVTRKSGPLPGDVPARMLMKLPPGVADAQMKVIRRLALGDLSKHGLLPPPVGLFTRMEVEDKAPAVVDHEVLDAIKDGRIEVVAGLESFDERGVKLADGTRIEPDAVIAATGYTAALEPLVGHLDVLDARGLPRVHEGHEAAPGLFFIGYKPRPGQIRNVGREARRAARTIATRQASAPVAA